ncbi:MAG TPA: hypothetical protein VLJ59_04325 [Mycobacteriales bacterium]|nr:hypothetical protein [Mycobacteriales bacterium]
MAGFDPKKVSTLDWVVIGAGVLAFIASFFAWYTISLKFGGIEVASGSVNAWHSFASWFATLLLVAAAGLVFAKAAGVQVSLPLPVAVVTLGLSGFAVLLILLRWITLDTGVGAGFGLYLGLISAIAAAVASFLAFRATGGDLRRLGQTPGTPQPPSGL